MVDGLNNIGTEKFPIKTGFSQCSVIIFEITRSSEQKMADQTSSGFGGRGDLELILLRPKRKLHVIFKFPGLNPSRISIYRYSFVIYVG